VAPGRGLLRAAPRSDRCEVECKGALGKGGSHPGYREEVREARETEREPKIIDSAAATVYCVSIP